MDKALELLTSTLFGANGTISTVFGWVVSADVLPYFAIGIGCSLALFGVKVIRSVVWGA